VKVVFLDATGTGTATPAGAEARSLEEIVGRGLGDGEALVVYAPAPGWQGEDPLVEALGRSGAAAIVVRAERADGFTEDPLAAACRGLIAGFGAAGLAEAVAILGAAKPG
jgi:hypothetical protein